jgi:hypothetical protein
MREGLGSPDSERRGNNWKGFEDFVVKHVYGFVSFFELGIDFDAVGFTVYGGGLF